MKTKYRLSLLIVTLLLVSCKEEVETQSSTAPKEIIMPRVQPLPVAATPNIASVPNQNIQNTPQAMPVMPEPIKVAKGMNPAHGQPGHRCDIAVGASLNSPKVAAPASPATAEAPYTITQTPTTTTTSIPIATAPAILNPDATTPTAPGMNPPHGQEGHTCSVKVGEPLPK